jgi:hypothetical protein
MIFNILLWIVWSLLANGRMYPWSCKIVVANDHRQILQDHIIFFGFTHSSRSMFKIATHCMIICSLEPLYIKKIKLHICNNNRLYIKFKKEKGISHTIENLTTQHRANKK